ncbi:PhzF family phenazine biosynthesis protein [Photobacterium nomapromontoriensis]|uniref:PhzF family phenazine biosynthesis protein n=1 Tax=Photobacterium nomapromontoriensis TaxID=2910237 RepID=UPI003D0C8C9D
MEMDIFVVDAFTDQQFKGNSAAVVPVEHWLSAQLMQSIAEENNLSETAFIKHVAGNQYEIRWFSPLTEIDFCGHATLASAYILFHEFGVLNEIEFITAEVGTLTVILNQDHEIEMTFPSQKPEPVAVIPEQLISGLSIKPIEVLRNRQAYFAILNTEQDVLDVMYESELLKQLAPYDVVVTSTSRKYDFISRYFWPANGGDEDPVTGSVHAGLAPYWAEELNKPSLLAYQASSRGGILKCVVLSQHVIVSGKGVLYMKGRIHI